MATFRIRVAKSARRPETMDVRSRGRERADATALDEEARSSQGDQRDYTPRRYEQPTEDDPVMPTADSSLDPKV